MAEGNPSFTGTADEQKVASAMFGLMLMQSRAFAANVPIRQSLRNFANFFVEQNLRASQAEATALIESAVKANGHVFFRQAENDEVWYYTCRKGVAVPPPGAAPTRYVPPAAAIPVPPAPVARKREGGPVVITRATVTPVSTSSGQARTGPALPAFEEAGILRTIPKPVLIKPDQDTMEPIEEQEEVLPPTLPTPIEVEEEPVFIAEAAPTPVATAPAVKRPQMTTSEGTVVFMDAKPEEILDAHGPYLQSLLSDALGADSRFVSFGQEWQLADMVTSYTKADLRRAHDAIEDAADVLLDTTLLTDLYGKNPDDDDFERSRFSLNYALAREKRVFEFHGTGQERYWGLVGMASLRPSRTVLRSSEIGQDFKFLEDETPRTDEGAGRWIHALTFYEIENGLLPYSATGKIIFPKPVLKDQRVAQLEFHAPQLNLTVTAELHYPTGNRGGWVEGLEDILDHFVPGTRVFVEGTDRDNLFLLTYRKSEPMELETVRYDDKKRRFGFATVTVDYQVDESMLITRSSFKNLANALRLEENARRKGDQVIAFAFVKVGAKLANEEKPVYRASVGELLPLVNLEKPFSRTSLVRFMTTHPHYKKDETTEEGIYLYKPED
jgi:hypothetical protein